MSRPLLDVESLSVSYGKVEAVHHVSLQVGAGQIVTVIGPNGAGKTTLLGAIMGLLPGRGSIRYDGQDLARERQHVLGFVVGGQDHQRAHGPA